MKSEVIRLLRAADSGAGTGPSGESTVAAAIVAEITAPAR